jgi:arylsulfatase B
MPDDQGNRDVSCHGNPIIKTAQMDKFHDESPCLTNFHVSPTYSPTRTSLMTGHYNNRTGVWHTISGRSLLNREEATMADMFSESGYRTGIFGK